MKCVEQLSYPFDASYLLKKRKSIKRELLAASDKRIHKNIAVLGGSTVHDVVDMLELFLLHYGIEPSFYVSEYGQYWTDAMFENEKLAAFQPDVLYIHTTSRNLEMPPIALQEPEAAVNERLEAQYARFEAMWEKLKQSYGCTVIQNNFEPPAYRVLGNMDAYQIHGATWFINAMNQKLYAYARNTKNFYIHDINHLAACFGLDKWLDLSAWYLYKYAFSLSAVPEFAFNLANILKSIFGKNKKALALDLDNTLWGGVIAEDGLSGIEIGKETASGNAFYDFQMYLSQLKGLGVTLNICSKNDEEMALLGLSHPENVLHAGDFVSNMANWHNKDENILQIAESLQILPESIVFVDDNPAERALVKGNLGIVETPDMFAPEQYIRTLDKSAFFEPTVLSEDDLKRNQMYQENITRRNLANSFPDYNEYLKSLAMTAIIKPFEPLYAERITQLTNKSNQFNLTTKRYTLSQINGLMSNVHYISLYGKLADRFGDNGIVSLVVGECVEDALHIDLWLMSCRVLKRNMEYAMLDSLVSSAKKRGIDKVFGYYYKTAKNEMVENLFQDFGFQKAEDLGGGNTKWELGLAQYQNKNTVIAVEENENGSE